MKIMKPSEQSAPPSAPGKAPTRKAPPELTEQQQKIVQWLPLWICAAFLLLGNLGVSAIYGSEARWLVIVREMFQSNDFLHPTINFEPYFDKPLLTYWFIMATSVFNRHVVTELIARIPSVLAALAALVATAVLVRRLWDSKIALLSCWLFMTFYSFAFWGRLAEADMANLAFSTAAIAWYVAYREEKSFRGYLGFFLFCFIGAHAKGMATVVVPFLAAFVDMVLNKRFMQHLNWKSVLALVIGVGVYLLPFGLSKAIAPAIPVAMQDAIDGDGTLKTSGVALALRENVIRYFAPFDHKEPFYAYFIHVPRLTLPWTPFLILAIIQVFIARKMMDKNEKWLCWTMIAIFLFFTISGSKRHYYILPLMPFCAVLCALFMLKDIPGWIGKTRDFLLKLYQAVPICGFLLAFFVMATLALFPSLIPTNLIILKRLLPQTMMTFLAGAFVIGLFLFRVNDEKGVFVKGLPLRLARAVFSVYVALLIGFTYLIPVSNQFRPEKKTLQNMAKIIQDAKVPPGNIYFYDRSFINAVLYLNQPYRIPVLKKPHELEALRKSRAGERIFIISQNRFFDKLSPELLTNLRPTLKESTYPWDSDSEISKKYCMRVLKTEPKTQTEANNSIKK